MTRCSSPHAAVLLGLAVGAALTAHASAAIATTVYRTGFACLSTDADYGAQTTPDACAQVAVFNGCFSGVIQHEASGANTCFCCSVADGGSASAQLSIYTLIIPDPSPPPPPRPPPPRQCAHSRDIDR